MTKTHPHVSVIVTSLNSVRTIGHALDSILREASLISELIDITVIDGGSNDGTVERVRTYGSVRLINQTSQGLSAARNEAVAQVTGSHIAFCDSDDSWTYGSLGLKINALIASPSSWAVSGKVRFVERHDYPHGRTAKRLNGEEHQGLTPGAMLIRRSIFDHLAFDESLVIAGDADWLVRSQLKFGPPIYLDEVVLEKGIRSGSLSTNLYLYRTEMMVVARRFIDQTRNATQH
jgi:glycosyltransferase involved in cell wall biosynthesis